MYIHLYELNKRPDYIDDGGYFYMDEYVIGFSQDSNDKTGITLVEAIARGMLTNTKDFEGNDLTVEQIENNVVDFFEGKGFEIDENIIADSEMLITEELLNNARIVRDKLLTDSDFTQISDSPFSAEEKATWATYRNELRDLPEDNGSVLREIDIIWPDEPI